MPLLKLETTTPLPESKCQVLLKSLSQAVAQITGKPEQYVMVSWTQSVITMAGTFGRGGIRGHPKHRWT